jgi:hypothetical protein
MFHDILFLLFSQCYINNPSWGHGNITRQFLLYIKDDPTYIQNYKPIVFVGKIYNVFTSTLSNLLTSHKEHFKILHNIQEGFCPMRNTTCQFQTIIAALKDGKCMNNDIYIALMVFKMPLASPCNYGQSWVPQDANNYFQT